MCFDSVCQWDHMTQRDEYSVNGPKDNLSINSRETDSLETALNSSIVWGIGVFSRN